LVEEEEPEQLGLPLIGRVAAGSVESIISILSLADQKVSPAIQSLTLDCYQLLAYLEPDS